MINFLFFHGIAKGMVTTSCTTTIKIENDIQYRVNTTVFVLPDQLFCQRIDNFDRGEPFFLGTTHSSSFQWVIVNWAMSIIVNINILLFRQTILAILSITNIVIEKFELPRYLTQNFLFVRFLIMIGQRFIFCMHKTFKTIQNSRFSWVFHYALIICLFYLLSYKSMTRYLFWLIFVIAECVDHYIAIFAHIYKILVYFKHRNITSSFSIFYKSFVRLFILKWVILDDSSWLLRSSK